MQNSQNNKTRNPRDIQKQEDLYKMAKSEALTKQTNGNNSHIPDLLRKSNYIDNNV